MKNIVFVCAVFCLLIYSHKVQAREINFGFYYASIEGEPQANLDKITSDIDSSLIALDQFVGIHAKNIFTKSLPFSPAVIDRGLGLGVDGEVFFKNMRQNNLDYGNADFIFIIVPITISVRLTMFDGWVESIPGKAALICYKDTEPQDYLTSILAHEFGHLLGINHAENDSCGPSRLIMCQVFEILTKDTAIGKSFEDALKALP
ncbi:MAG: hypothetical protein Q7S12_00515 [bacterium]|nr:hypothetical protein [bacterium]